MGNLIFEAETYALRGAVFDVYRELGAGFLEPVYQECLERELAARSIPFQAHPQLRIRFKNALLTQVYVPDFVCFDQIIVEIKAVAGLSDEHRAQLHNYLRATGLRLGILVNFGHHPGVETERIVR